MSDTLRIYSFPLSGHSHRVVLFANLAGIAHEVIKVDLATGEHKQAPYLAINPLGQVPAIQDGKAIICDSNAILVYLARKYAPQYLPTDLVLEAEVQKFLTVAAGDLMYGACTARLITVFNGPFDPAFTATVAEAYLGRMEVHLAEREYLVGDSPTIADVALYTYTAHAPEGNISLEAYPNVRRWLANIEALDGFVPMIETKVGLRA